MNTPDEKLSPAQAAGYIAGVGLGYAASVLRGHFWLLLAGTAALLGALIFAETQVTLLRCLGLYLAFAVTVFAHAFLRKLRT